MQIAITALGSRGDVQPYIALGKGLQQAGHAVRLVSHEDYEQLATAHGLDFWPLQGNLQEVVQTEEMRQLLEKGNFFSIMTHAADKARRAALNWAEEGLAACQDRELLIAGIGALFVGLALAEKLDLPLLQAHYVPFTPTSAFPGALAPQSIPRILNRWSHHATRQMMWQTTRSADKPARQQVLGLPAAPFWGPYNAARLRRSPILYGFSPAVIPKPADWGAHIHLTGYWFVEAEDNWTPPADLQAFLAGGPPPVYVGFGSMGSRRPEETADLVLQALAKTGQRAIMLSGWGGLRKDDLPDSVFMIDAIPHAWLFPRVAAVVHHGGAGTTAAGLRAGVPTIVIPFFGDQPFWGRRVADLGVGPEPIPRKKLTADKLAQALHQTATDAVMRRRAADLGATIQAEDGVACAVALIDDFLQNGAF